MSHYCKLKAMKEFNKGTKPVFSFYVRPLYQDVVGMEFLDGKKRIIICYFNAYSVSIRFQELKGFD
jgi:hypothetical protein